MTEDFVWKRLAVNLDRSQVKTESKNIIKLLDYLSTLGQNLDICKYVSTYHNERTLDLDLGDQACSLCLPNTCCVILGKLPNPSELQFPNP